MKHRCLTDEIGRRRTFAIISHPDAGKTTITEKFLLLGKVIQTAGTVKSRGSNHYAKSDWMAIEKRRGISITTSVMQFPYKNCLINLLDTPGHEDFSEDTYRTLTAVDSCLMVIDAAKGVENRTRKLMKVTRLRNTPIITFINKLDRDSLHPIELIDNIESELKTRCAPITWPIGCGSNFKGIYHLYSDYIQLYKPSSSCSSFTAEDVTIRGLNNPKLTSFIGSSLASDLREEVELLKSASYKFSQESFLNGQITPIFFGSALGDFGIDQVLDSIVAWAPPPMPRKTDQRTVTGEENSLSGFIFKIQANMDPRHFDRIAFMRIVSGRYRRGIKLIQVRTGKELTISDALNFMAGNRSVIEEAYPGDIIGLHNHGTIRIGDTFSQGEKIKFIGIPSFAPELFRRIRSCDPLKQKTLLRGLIQLSEEGAVQIFRPMKDSSLVIGTVGSLQLDVAMARLSDEYKIKVIYESVNAALVRWISCSNTVQLHSFCTKYEDFLALDWSNNLAYIAPSAINLSITREKNPNINFHEIREY